MAEPAWKIAMRERKKQKEEEEKKKKAQQEAYLASVPAWKRPMLLKKLEAEKSTTEEKPQAPSSSPPVQDKWKQAFERSSKVPTATTTSEPHPSTDDKPVIPAWKQALQERQRVAEAKKKLEESKRNSQLEIPTSSSPPGVPKSLPAQKGLANKMKEQFESKPVDEAIDMKSSVILQSPSGSPVILKRISTSSPRSSPQSSPQIQRAKISTEPTDGNGSPPLPSRATTTVQPTTTSNTAINTGNTGNTGGSTASSGSMIDETSPEFLAMPVWKREVLLRKMRKATGQAPQPAKPSTTTSSSGGFKIPQLKHVNRPSISHETLPTVTPPSPAAVEPPANVPPSDEVKKVENVTEKKVEEVKKEPTKPEIVNSSENAESSSPKLIQKEGKTLRAPVFKSTGKWANITTDDPEFQKLPLWKQELIKRRTEDQVNRTKPIQKEEPKEEKKSSKPPPSSISTPWERLNNTSENKVINTPKPSTPITTTKPKEREETTTSNEGASKVQALLGRWGQSTGGVINRKVPPPAATNKQNGEVTLIDEESSDDEGPPPVMKTTRSSSILKSPEKPTKRKLSISWSDSNLSHFYPKYDYSDYDEIEQPSVPEEETDLSSPTSPEPAIATPIHPWLASTNTKSPPPNTNTGGGLSYANFNSANSFMSMYMLNSPLPPPMSTTPTKTEDTKKPQDNMSPADVYNNIDSDTAALLF